MLTDIWAGVAPGIVTAPFATAYVSALGTSDYLGRRNTYALFGLGIPIVGMAPILTQRQAGGSCLSLIGSKF
jgi:hypothetical protein